jgi:5-methyltetrahydrofolate--homocysteine methyltransferase
VSRLTEWLAGGPLIADGAWGTELQKHGLALGASPDSWNLTHPERVEAVARAYVEAGSQVILTNTFRANAIAIQGDLAGINRAGVAISKRAAERRALVFASIGPMGKPLGKRQTAGAIAREEAYAAFAAQAETLAAAGADALVLETMSDIAEARVAVVAVKSTGLPVIVSFFLFDATPEAVAAAMVEAGADGIGANCIGVDQAAALCGRLRAACDLPIWIKPSAGLPKREGTAIRYDMPAEFFASHCAALREAGASFVGGCCGTTPDFIRAANGRGPAARVCNLLIPHA